MSDRYKQCEVLLLHPLPKLASHTIHTAHVTRSAGLSYSNFTSVLNMLQARAIARLCAFAIVLAGSWSWSAAHARNPRSEQSSEGPRDAT